MRVCFVQAFKQSAIAIVREYFLSADTEEVATAVSELGKPDLHHIFVKQVSNYIKDFSNVQ